VTAHRPLRKEIIVSEDLEFHPLTFVPDGDGVMVGRQDIETYAVLPADGAELLRQMTEGLGAEQAASWYADTFGEQIDMADFLATLADLGFLRGAGEAVAAPAKVRYQTLGRALFSPAAWICYSLIGVGAIAAMVIEPRLRPNPQLVFFSSSLIAVQVVLTVIQMPTMCFHEWFHVMAGRRLGLPTRLGVNRRFYFFVFETHLNGLLGVEKRKRYLPFVAGLLGDLLLFCVLTLAAAAGGSSLLARLALAIAYTVLLRLTWQALVFMRTDPYYALTTLLGCTDLTGASAAYLRDVASRLRSRGRPTDSRALSEDTWSPRDRAIAPWFALLSVLGGTVLVGSLVFTLVPVIITFIDRLVSGLAHGSLSGTRFWDATVTVTLFVVQVTVLPIVAGRHAARSARAAARAEPISHVTKEEVSA
jgi:hypothetical protein